MHSQVGIDDASVVGSARARTLGLLLTGAIALAALPAGGAAAASPAGYKQRMNAICRSYTPSIHKLERDATLAQKRGDQHRWGRDIGLVIGIALLESDRLLRVPVPVALKSEMTTPLRLLRAANAAAKNVLDAPHTTRAVFSALDRFDRLSTPVNRSLDAVGLRDCGSNQ